MKQNLKRLFSFAMAVLMALSLVPFNGLEVYAADTGEAVAKVGSTEYATIDEAIANWTNGSTLTLLADVTLSDVVTLKSTEHHILNLSTFTMTAASGKHAIEITCEGRSSASYALTVNADATNPGGITATGKSCIYYSKSDSTKDRPIILINNGVFNGSYSINSKSNGNTNCPQIWINGGTFNGNVNLTKNMLRVSGGTFNGWINCTGDSSAYRQISGGTFKNWQFMTADANNKFWVGTSKANYDVGVYVDDNGYLVVGGPVITEAGDKFVASANYSGWSSYLKYSSAAENKLYYTSLEEALADNNKTTGVVTVYADTLDMAGISYKGTIVAPEGKTLKITNAPEGLKTEGNVVVVKPVAQIGDTYYNTLEEAFAVAVEGDTIILLSDATPALTSQRAITKATVIDLNGKTLTLTEDDLYFGTTTFKNGNVVVDPSVKPSTAVFWMFKDQTLTFDAVKLTATGVTGTYLIGLDGNNADLKLLSGSEIYINNETALDLDVICVNASTGNDILIDNSKVTVNNLEGRVFFRGNYTVSGNSDIDLTGITKAGFRIEAGQTLTIADTVTVDIAGEPRDGGIHLTDVTAVYNKADTATVNATINAPVVEPVGSLGTCYIEENAERARVYGEILGMANAEQSVVVKLYSGETLLATTTLAKSDYLNSDPLGVNIVISGKTSSSWNTVWEAGHPRSDMCPDKAVLYIDGAQKNTATVTLGTIDDLGAPYVWEEITGVKKIVTGLKGAGTESDPYLIGCVEELLWFQEKVDEQAADGSTQFAGKYFQLTADIDLDGINWNPIGSMSGDHGSFKGVFDGNGHTIKNLNCQQAGNGLGLFARTAGSAQIKNLTLNNVTVKSTDNSNYVGAVVGNSYASTKITNVHVTGAIDISGRGYIGGISGHGYVVMDNVSVVGEGTISSTFWCAGGILGYGGEGATNIMNAKVEGTGETGLTITSAAGGLGSIVGMAEDNNGTQPISGSNLSAKNVNIKTYTGAYGDAYANYALGYLYGGNPTSELTGELKAENVVITTSNGEAPKAVDVVATVGDAVYFDLQSALDAAVAGTGNVTVEILRDVDLTKVDWDPVTVSGPGYPLVTVNGNNKTITGLNDMLFAGTWAGKSGLIINDLTIKDSTIVNDKDDAKGTVGVGAFIGYPQASAIITLSNCHLVDSRVEGGHWTGGLIGMAGGYNGNDGPVFMNLTITDCSVTGSTITGKGSAGGVIGHGSCAAWTNVVIEDTTVSGNTITSTGSSTVKAGSVMGTIGAAGKPATANGETKTGGAFVSVTTSGNTVTSNGTAITTIYGRQGSDTGMLTVTGGTYEAYPIEENVSYAAPKTGYKIVENENDTYGLAVCEYKVSTKAELNAALAAAQEGDKIILTADIDYGTDQLKLEKAITLDLGGFALTTRNAYGGMSVKSNPTIKNGTIIHASNTAAIKVWNAAAFEDLVIDVQGKGDANKTIGGIVLQSSTTTRVDSIKNVTIKGDALTNGIETYNCGNATADVIGSMENVTVDAKGTGMLISAPCGTATNCSISGDVNGIEIWIKGTYSAKLDLVNSTVEGGVFAHDEFSSNPGIVNNGTLNLTADSETTGASMTDVTLTIARAEKVEGVLKDVMDNAVAKVNNTYYLSLSDAFAAAQDGDTVTILAGDYTADISVKSGITVVGETDDQGNNLVNITGRVSVSSNGTVKNLTVKNAKTGDYDCALVVNGKDIVIEGCDLSGYNAMRYCYANGDVTIKNSKLEGSNFTVHFDGSTGANIAFENCEITGWCSYASTVNSVSYTNCSIDQGDYAGHRYYNKNVSFTDCKFAEGMKLDLRQTGSNVAITDADMTVAEAKALFKDPYYVAKGNITLNGDQLTYAASAYTASGSKYFDSLQDAINEVNNGGYITVRSDIVLTAPITVPAGRRVDIGLGDFNITYTSDVMGEAMITNNGELTISGNGNVLYTYTGAADSAYGKGNYTIANNGKLTIDGVTIENATAAMKHAFYAITNGNGGEIILEDGLIKNTNNYAVRMFGKGSMTVNDGEVIGTRAVWMQAPGSDDAAPEISLTVNDGKLTATGESADYKLAVYSYTYGNSLENVSITVNGGELDGDIALSGGSNKTVAETVTITGGTITDLYSYAADEVAAKTINVSGGIFKNAVAEVYCAEGYIPADNGDGTYGVKLGSYVAQVGDTKYESLQAAIDAATAGQTITLLADVNENVIVNKNLTIDGAGKNYTGKMTLNKVNVTIENVNFVKGTVYKNKNTGAGGNYTIKDCTFDGQGLSDYAINLGGTNNIVIENVTAKDYGYGLLQVPSSNVSLTVKNVKVSGCDYGFKVDYSNGVTMENVTVVGSDYGIYDSNHGTKTYTIKNSNISSIKIWERSAAKTTTFKFEGINEVAAMTTSQYAVVKGATIEGTNYYGSIQPLVEKAENDQTVKLLSDLTLTDADIQMVGSHKVMINVEGKNITLDMNGKKITVNYTGGAHLIAPIRVADGAGLTVTGNGSIDVPTNGINVAYMFWKAGSTGHLTIENGTYHMDNSADSMVYTNGDEIVTVKGGNWAIDQIGTRENGFPCIFNAQGSGDRSIIVTGGTYNDDINHQHWGNEAVVDKTCYVVDNGDGTWTVKPGAVAYVDLVTLTGPYFAAKDFGFATLEEAFAAAGNGNTITLLADIELTAGVTVPADKTITLDLNGKTITGKPAEAKAFSVINNKGDLTIEGSGSVVCDHQLAGSTGYAVNTITNSGTLTIDGATIENKSTAAYQIGYAIDNNSTTGDAVLVIKNGEVKASGSNYYDGIRQFCNSLTNKNAVTVEGGAVSSIWLQNPSDGTVEKDQKEVKGSVSITGGTVNALYLEPSAAFDAEITGGYVGKVEYFTTSEGRDLIQFITGGTFGMDVTAYCALGYQAVANTGGTYTVERNESIVAWNMQTGAQYETVMGALLAAKENETVQLIKDSNEANAVLTVLNGITLDLNGHTLTAYYAMTATVGSYIIDSTDGQGLLKVAKNNLVLADNTQLKIWKEEENGYRFAAVSFKTNLASSEAGKATFMFYLNEANGAVMEELADGAADNDGLYVQVRMTYTNSQGGRSVLYFDFPADKVVEYAEKEYNGKASYLFMTIAGLDTVTNVSFEAVVGSGSIMLASAAASYNG